jgi:hypothetical protein
MDIFSSPGIQAGSIPISANKFIVWLRQDSISTCRDTSDAKLNQVGILDMSAEDSNRSPWAVLTNDVPGTIQGVAVAFGHIYTYSVDSSGNDFVRRFDDSDIGVDVHHGGNVFDVLNENKVVYFPERANGSAFYIHDFSADVDQEDVSVSIDLDKPTRPFALHTKEEVNYFAIVDQSHTVVHIYDANGDESMSASFGGLLDNTDIGKVHIYKLNEETWNVLFTNSESDSIVYYTQIIQGTG